MIPKESEDVEVEKCEGEVIEYELPEAEGRDSAYISRLPKMVTLEPAVKNTPEQVAVM